MVCSTWRTRCLIWFIRTMGEELRAALENMCLTAYVGIMPHLTAIPKEIELPANTMPWAMGYSLFVHIEVWDTDVKATDS